MRGTFGAGFRWHLALGVGLSRRVDQSADESLLGAIEDQEFRVPLNPQQEVVLTGLDPLNQAVPVTCHDIDTATGVFHRLVMKAVDATPADPQQLM